MADTCWCPVFACPECRAALRQANGSLCCDACDRSFPSEAGIVRFLTDERRRRSDVFHEQYRLVRERDGHGPRTPEACRALPWVAPERDVEMEWRIRRQTFASLLRWGRERASSAGLRFLDLGSGSGWLSNQLAAGGHRPVALDRYDDMSDGLGVCRVYEVAFPVVQADFDALPFAPGQFDAVVFNASLHYSPDPAHTLREAGRVLGPSGAVVVMDSPMFDDDRDGEAMVREQTEALQGRFGISNPVRPGVGFLTYARLAALARELGRQGRFIATRGPLRWRLGRQWRRLRLDRAPAAFGMWVAQ